MFTAINIRICIKLLSSFQRKLRTKPHQENYKSLFTHMANQAVFKIKTLAWTSIREVREMKKLILSVVIIYANFIYTVCKKYFKS